MAAPAVPPMVARDVAWVKGHGTRNDFVLLDDPDGHLFGDLDPALVRRLCDRHEGVGADGVLRVIRSAALAGSAVLAGNGADLPEWFMDYRNADGTAAEMCGNGVRVFAQYLLVMGRTKAGSPVELGTRAGIRTARPVSCPEPEDDRHRAGADGHQPSPGSPADPSSGWWSVDMGVVDLARYRTHRPGLTVAVDGRSRMRPAVGADVGNPHAVVLVADLADAGTLATAPQVTPPGVFPDGVNVEFVERTGPASFAMRVFERGAGETQSCGTGICAAAAVLHATGQAPDAARTYDASVPGGWLTAAVTPVGTDRFGVTLAGPAVLVGEGRLTR